MRKNQKVAYFEFLKLYQLKIQIPSAWGSIILRRVLFHIISVTPRQRGCRHRYAGVGIFVDGAVDAAAMTPNPYQPGRAAFDMLSFKTAILI